MSLLIAPGIVGQSILIICQLWLLLLPIAWLFWVERKPVNISKPKQRDWITGVVIGLLMFCVILAAYSLFLSHWINVADVREKIQKIANINQDTFKFGGFYFIFVNALIEEYFWRWFIFSRCEEVVPGKVAVLFSALFFMVHHTIGLAVLTNWRVALVGSLAVFVAGALWSEYFRRHRSIWSNYFSHAIADLALHFVAWQVFFA